MQQADPPDDVRRAFRRQVFYISGFDPRGALFLYENCVAETQKWSQATGYHVGTGRRRSLGAAGRSWPITAELPDGAVETDFRFLQWDDIIRRHWDRSEWRIAVRAFALAFSSIRSGVYGQALRKSRPFAVTMLSTTLPVLVPAACALLLLTGLVCLWLSTSIFAVALGSILQFGAGALFWRGRRAIGRFKCGWTGRVGLFARELTERRVSGLEERVETMVAHIIKAIEQEEPDEALVIGHSLGTMLAALVVSRVLARKPEFGAEGSKLTLVTLGQIHSLVLPAHQAGWLRDELSCLARFPTFAWLDFSAPPDSACYALVDPLDFLPGARAPNLPLLLNAQFHRSFSPERMTQARADRMAMHFLYLQAPDRPQLDTDLYDFVALVAGPVPARRRFSARRSGRAYYGKATG